MSTDFRDALDPRGPVKLGDDSIAAPRATTAAAADPRVFRLRTASVAVLVAFIAAWNLRATEVFSWSVLGLSTGFAFVCAVTGSRLAAVATPLLGARRSVAFEFLLGFFACNTVLFVLTLFSPLGMVVHVGLIASSSVVLLLLTRSRRWATNDLQGEWASFASIVFCGLAATLWVSDQQPVVKTIGDQSVFCVWADIFIHVREVSAFAQAHGLASISDIKLADVRAPIYHFASYMLPAAFNALTGTSALDAYVAFQLPFGILLVGLAAFALTAWTLKRTWPAVVASIAVMSLPDSSHQGVSVRYLSFHVMSQINPGMLYGIACASMAWLFMIEACRRGRVLGLVVAYGFLAILVAYKAHLFVANALILMLYPCLFFDRSNARFRPGSRILAAIGLVVLFATVVVISQRWPSVPTLRLDGSGVGRYVDLLTRSFRDGFVKDVFEWSYADARPRVVRAVVAALFITTASFGWWLVLAPWALRKTRRSDDPMPWVFVAFVFVNYVVMSLGLALDDRSAGSPEELVNRPQAWAYFVVVAFGAAAAGSWALGRIRLSRRVLRWCFLATAGVLLYGVHEQAPNLETFPQWQGRAAFVEFNAAPTCLVRSARYIRDHAGPSDLFQDGALDPMLMVTAVAERQGFVSDGTFGGSGKEVRARSDALRAVQASNDAGALVNWAGAHHVAWYVMHPDDAERLDSRMAERVVFHCGGYGVIHF